MAFDASEARDSQGRWVKVHFAGEERLVHAVPVRSKPHMLIASEGHFVGTAGAGKAKHPVRPFLLQKGDHWEVLQQVNVRNRPGRVTGFGEAKTNERNNRKADLATPKYRTIDLTGDGHGHHIPGTPMVYRHGWQAVKGSSSTTKVTRTATTVTAKRVTKTASAVRVVDKYGQTTDDPTVLRHFRKVTEEYRLQMFKDAGLDLKFPDKTTDELVAMWHSPNTSNDMRGAIRRELDVRQKQLEIAAKALDQSILDSKREMHRDHFRAFTDRLRKLPFGKAIIDFRERILKDGLLDKVEPVQRWLHKNGENYAHHIATAVAIGLVFTAIPPIAGIVGTTVGVDLIDHVLELLPVHAALATALGAPLQRLVEPILRPLSHEAKVERAKRALKHDLPKSAEEYAALSKHRRKRLEHDAEVAFKKVTPK